jgi:FAD:protein FMN transferase
VGTVIVLGLLAAWEDHPVTQALQRYEHAQVHMGLPVRIVLYGADERAANEAARAAFARIAALDQMMSDYRPDSELRRLEQSAGTVVRVSPELFETVSRAIEVARATDGAFDPTVGHLVALWREARRTGRLPEPDALDRARAQVGWRKIRLDATDRTIRIDNGVRLDLGGIAKGYILQEALRTLRTRGVTQALGEGGGDIVVADAPPGAHGWRIDTPGADPPFSERAARLSNSALATAGATAQFVEIDGVRYSHIVDPRTGLGLTHHFITRVIAEDATLADALATAINVLGAEAVPRLRSRFPGIVVSMLSAPPEPSGAGSPTPRRRR